MKRWMKYVMPYLPFFILGPICMIIEVLGEAIMPKLMAVIINNANAGTLTSGTSILYMCLMILTAIVMMAGGVGGAYFACKASVNFSADLRMDLYTKVQEFSFANIDKFQTSSLVTRLTNDVTQVANFIVMLLRMCLRAPGMMIAGIIMAITINPKLSMVFVVSMPILIVIVLFVLLIGSKRFATMQTKVDDLNSTIQENVTNVRVVKSFVREDFENEKFHKATGNLMNASISAMKLMIVLEPVMTIIMNATILAVIIFGGDFVLKGEMEVGDLSAFLTYVRQILFSLVMLTFVFMMSSRAFASGKRIGEVLDEKVDINDDNAKAKDKQVTEGSIEFKNISYKYYKHNEERVLSEISLKIDPGMTVGIIGSTGCGKSTLVSMIPRLYDVDSGDVLVDGVSVKDYSLKNLRDGVGMVLQKNTLFTGSIADNLRWGNEDASMEEIEKYAEYAQADKFVKGFKEGYDTMIDQGGTNVSGGQKQRLCIARALLKKPKILIFDDSTSAVDTATEALIRKAFAEDLKSSTKIIIAQRIGSVKDADMIVVMNEGKITGVGKHDDLLRDNVEYKEIYDSQMGQEG